METSDNKQCRFCLGTTNGKNIRKIGDIPDNVFECLLLKLNFDDITEHVLCISCMKSLYDVFNFNSECLRTNNAIIPYIEEATSLPLDLRQIYIQEKGDKCILKDTKICSLCMQPVTSEFKAINEVETDLLKQFLPEISFNSIKEPVMCKTCVDSLAAYRLLRERYLGAQQKMSNTQFLSSSSCTLSQEDVGMETKMEVIEPLVKFECVDIKEEEIEIENDDFNQEVALYKNSANYNNEQELPKHKKIYTIHQTESKNEQLENCELKYHYYSEIGVYKCGKCSFQSKLKKCLQRHLTTHKRLFKIHNLNQSNPRKRTKTSNTKIYKCDICDYHAKYRIEITRHKITHENPLTVKMYKCDKCNYENKFKRNLRRHILCHKHPSRTKYYLCKQCDFGTKYKSDCVKHQLIHDSKSGECEFDITFKEILTDRSKTVEDQANVNSEMYVCKDCHYKTNHKRYMKKHEIKHRELQIFNCNSCTFKSRYKQNLNAHMKRNHSDMNKYKCEKCNYRTFFNDDIKKHQQIYHKDPSELKIYMCEVCGFRTKYRNVIKDHKITHLGSSEIESFNCTDCAFVTKSKRYLRRHLQRHKVSKMRLDKQEQTKRNVTLDDVKDRSVMKKFNCDYCDYETKYRSDLKRHLVSHEDFIDGGIYKCDICDYSNSHKRNLTRHQKSHKNDYKSNNDVEMKHYKCEICDFHTTLSTDFLTHQLKHDCPSDSKSFKCQKCNFQTKYRNVIKDHQVVHMDPSEIEWHECDQCDFKTKLKCYLTRHMRIHKEAMHKCEICGYGFKCKGDLNRHRLKHKDRSEVEMFKCDYCEYETKYKPALRGHIVIHDNSVDVKIYKCEVCDFQSKHKRNVVRHQKTHKSIA